MQGSAISAFNSLAAQKCVLHRQGFSSSVYWAVVGETGAYMTKISHNVRSNGQVGVLKRV